MIHYCPMTQQDSLFPNEEYVQHDVKSLFSNVPIQETIDYVLGEIYVKNKLPKISSKFIFKRLLLKLTTENTFIFRKKLTVAGGPLLLYFQICMYISIKYVIKSLSNFYIYIYIYISLYIQTLQFKARHCNGILLLDLLASLYFTYFCVYKCLLFQFFYLKACILCMQQFHFSLKFNEI